MLVPTACLELASLELHMFFYRDNQKAKDHNHQYVYALPSCAIWESWPCDILSLHFLNPKRNPPLSVEDSRIGFKLYTDQDPFPHYHLPEEFVCVPWASISACLHLPGSGLSVLELTFFPGYQSIP